MMGGGGIKSPPPLALNALFYGGKTDVIVMDFSKAFDKVPHKELLFKLSNYGIDKYTLRWYKISLITGSSVSS